MIFHDFTFETGNIKCSVSSIDIKQFKSDRCKCKHRKGDSELVQSDFATLEEAFRLLPKDLGFNIEIKYPSSNEIEDIAIYNYQSIDTYCECILSCVLENCKGRKIFFSSFNPEICLTLKYKQNVVPVFILTDGGFGFDSDCMSVREAAKFAASFKLDGIVCESKILINSIKIMEYLRLLKMKVFSYGECNNFDDHIKHQLEHGIDGVIVDRLKTVFPVIEGHRKRGTSNTSAAWSSE